MFLNGIEDWYRAFECDRFEEDGRVHKVTIDDGTKGGTGLRIRVRSQPDSEARACMPVDCRPSLRVLPSGIVRLEAKSVGI